MSTYPRHGLRMRRRHRWPVLVNVRRLVLLFGWLMVVGVFAYGVAIWVYVVARGR